MNPSRKDLIKYLNEFVFDKRKQIFEKKIKERTEYITIVLENIFQARNIAASIRSADCFGIQDVHVIENHNAFQHDSEVSIGAEKWITTRKYNKNENNTLDAINSLKKEGYQIIATTPNNADNETIT